MYPARSFCGLAAALAVLIAAIASAADPAVEKLFRDARAKILKNAGQRPSLHLRAEHRPYPVSAARSRPSALLSGTHRRASPPRRARQHRYARPPSSRCSRSRRQRNVLLGRGRRFETDALEKLVPGGVSGSGDFIGFMASVFGGDAQSVTYRGLVNDQLNSNIRCLRPAAITHINRAPPHPVPKKSPATAARSSSILLTPNS